MHIDIFFTSKPPKDVLVYLEGLVQVDGPSGTYWHALVPEKALRQLTGYLTYPEFQKAHRLSGEPVHCYAGRGKQTLERLSILDGRIIDVG